MFLLSLFKSKQKEPRPFYEIVRAIRVLKKKNIDSLILITDIYKEDINSLNSKLRAEDIVSLAKNSQKNLLIGPGKVIGKVSFPPFPSGVYNSNLSDNELAALGYSQERRAAAISISNNRLSLAYQGSIKTGLSSRQVYKIILLIFDRLKNKQNFSNKLEVKKV